MSRQRFAAKLDGYDGPYFPEDTDAIIDLLESTGNHSRRELIRILLHVDSYSGIQHDLQTSDGYVWFAGVLFSAGYLFFRRTVCLAIPWKGDRQKADGTEYERSIAFYAKRRTSLRQIESLAAGILAALKKYAELQAYEVTERH